jgi:hypothetical protein
MCLAYRIHQSRIITEYYWCLGEEGGKDTRSAHKVLEEKLLRKRQFGRRQGGMDDTKMDLD